MIIIGDKYYSLSYIRAKAAKMAVAENEAEK